jgi:hypothetical protein
MSAQRDSVANTVRVSLIVCLVCALVVSTAAVLLAHCRTRTASSSASQHRARGRAGRAGSRPGQRLRACRAAACRSADRRVRRDARVLRPAAGRARPRAGPHPERGPGRHTPDSPGRRGLPGARRGRALRAPGAAGSRLRVVVDDARLSGAGARPRHHRRHRLSRARRDPRHGRRDRQPALAGRLGGPRSSTTTRSRCRSWASARRWRSPPTSTPP